VASQLNGCALMTTLRSARRRGAAAAVAGLLAAVAIMLAGSPAAADPTPSPTPAAPGAGAARAAPGSISWAVQPSSAQGPDGRRSFSYENLKPGTVVHDYVGVTNFSAVPVTFRVYATDAFNNASGGLDLLPAAKQPRDVGAWVSMLHTSVTLKPGERINEPFTLAIPSTATPGDHAGGVIASVTVTAENGAGTPVKVDRRLAVPLNLRVSGPLRSGFTIESVSSSFHGTANPVRGGGVDVTYTVHNTGNIRLNLTQDITARGLFGLVTLARNRPGALTDLLPGGVYHATVHLANVYPLGPMNVRVHAVPHQPAGVKPAPADPVAASFSVSMWATPWLVLLLIALLAGVFLVGRWLLRARRAARAQEVAAAVARARRETVAELKRKATAATARAGSGTPGGTDPGASG
jgi:WxL Interacting Protein, peptidoglycan binding domain